MFSIINPSRSNFLNLLGVLLLLLAIATPARAEVKVSAIESPQYLCVVDGTAYIFDTVNKRVWIRELVDGYLVQPPEAKTISGLELQLDTTNWNGKKGVSFTECTSPVYAENANLDDCKGPVDEPLTYERIGWSIDGNLNDFHLRLNLRKDPENGWPVTLQVRGCKLGEKDNYGVDCGARSNEPLLQRPTLCESIAYESTSILNNKLTQEDYLFSKRMRRALEQTLQVSQQKLPDVAAKAK